MGLRIQRRTSPRLWMHMVFQWEAEQALTAIVDNNDMELVVLRSPLFMALKRAVILRGSPKRLSKNGHFL